MKSLENFIIEKFKINSKTIKNSLSAEFCLVAPFNKMYDKFVDEYSDALLFDESNSSVAHLFVLRKSEAQEYDGNKDINIYKIPDEYDTLEDLENAYSDGTLDTEELEKLKFD